MTPANDSAPSSRAPLDPLLEPGVIALVGASGNPRSIGGRSLSNLTDFGYPGEVFPVNPFREEIAGRKCFPTVSAIPATVDLAIVAVAAAQVPAAVEDCVAAGVKAIVISSAGFAEVGAEGAELQASLARTARQTGIRILGPNCLGLIRPQLPMLASFTASLDAGHPVAGDVGFVSQSGAVGSHWLAAARERGLGLSSWITTGNEVDVDVADVIEFLAADPATRVIVGYVEGARDGDRFRAALRSARDAGKPTIILKVGSSAAGAQAAASHTASLVGSDELYSAVFRRYGVVRAHSLSELTDLAQAASTGLQPRGPRTGVLTISGGVGVMMADQCAIEGMTLPALPAAAQQPLHELCPTATTTNPVDTTAAGVSDPAILPAYLRSMIVDGEYDSLVVFLAHAGLNEPLTERLVSSIQPLRAEFPDRAMLISTLASPKNRSFMQDAGFAVVEDPTAAITTLAKLAVSPGLPSPEPDLETPIPASPDGPVNEYEAKRLLTSFGIPALQEAVVHSADDAAKLLERDPGARAFKIASARIPHKTDVGGVILSVTEPGAAREAFAVLQKRAEQAVAGAGADGVLVAPMVAGGAEVIVGVSRDPLFGPVVVFGAGGTDVENESDVATEIAPVSHDVARDLIARTRVGRRLAGGRGIAARDVDAAADIIVRLSLLLERWPDSVSSIEVNPLVVFEAGKGALALDALITVDLDNPASHESRLT